MYASKHHTSNQVTLLTYHIAKLCCYSFVPIQFVSLYFLSLPLLLEIAPDCRLIVGTHTRQDLVCVQPRCCYQCLCSVGHSSGCLTLNGFCLQSLYNESKHLVGSRHHGRVLPAPVNYNTCKGKRANSLVNQLCKERVSVRCCFLVEDDGQGAEPIRHHVLWV